MSSSSQAPARASFGDSQSCEWGMMDGRRLPDSAVAPMLLVAATNVYYNVQDMFDVVVIGLQAVFVFALYFVQLRGADASQCAVRVLSMAVMSTAFTYLLYSAYRTWRIWF